MWNILIDLVTANENVQYDIILVLILTYFLLLWSVVSIWVVIDAKRRYNSLGVAILWGLLVMILNFPTLVLYLMLRPEEEWWNLHDVDSVGHNGGVNVPLVNFVGEDGIHMSLELKINPRPQGNHNMTIDVGWNQENAGDKYVEEVKQVIEKPERVLPVKSKVSVDYLAKTKSALSGFSNKLKNTSKSLIEKARSAKTSQPNVEQSSTPEEKKESKSEETKQEKVEEKKPEEKSKDANN